MGRTEPTLAGRARRNASGIVSTLVTGIWLTALLTGQEWWLPALIVGYVVVVPVVSMLFGDEDEADWTEYVDGVTTDDVDAADADAAPTDDETALQTLRNRYARGELTDEQFERKVERLVATETLEDVEDRFADGARTNRDRAGREPGDHEPRDRKAGGREPTDRDQDDRDRRSLERERR